MANGLEKDVEPAILQSPFVAKPLAPPALAHPAALSDFHPLPARTRGQHVYLGLRRGLEWLGALVLLLMISPVMLVAALAVKLTSRGPAFYSQMRVGQNGRPFTILKLRTMIHQCESLTGPRWCMPGDPRITRLGYFLRLTHIDELPQLINVLLGHMSLIGPRPERPEFVRQLERAIPGYRWRLAFLPGITGLAQVQLPPDTEVAGVRGKLAYDLYYIRRVGPLLDLRVLGATLTRLFGLSFRWSARLLGLPSRSRIEEVTIRPLHEVEGERRRLRAAA